MAIAAENFARNKNLSPVVIPTMSNNKNEQLKLAHKLVDVMDRAKQKNCVTLLQYSVEKLKSFNAQVLLFARKEEYEKF